MAPITRRAAARRAGETAWATPRRAIAFAITPIGSDRAGRPQPSPDAAKLSADMPVNSDSTSR